MSRSYFRRRHAAVRGRKKSLIGIIYLYPIMAYFIGLLVALLYYTAVEIKEYKDSVIKIKTEFPLQQKDELQHKILVIKDYISWVRSNPNQAIEQYLSRKLTQAVNSIRTLNPVDSSMLGKISPAVLDSLDALNNECLLKISVFDTIRGIAYAPAGTADSSTLSDRQVWPGKPEMLAVNRHIDFSNKSHLDDPYSIPEFAACTIPGTTLAAGIWLDQTPTAVLHDLVLDSLSRIRYPNNEYVIVNTFGGKALLTRGTRSLPPLDINASGDLNWQGIYQKQIELARDSSGGFYTYYWRNHPGDTISEKTSYFTSDREWQWILGTGYFARDIEPVIASMKSQLWKDILSNALRFLFFLILISILGFGISRYLGNQAKRNINLFLNFFRRASQGMQVIDTENLAFSEFKTLAVAANKMISEREKIKTNLSSEKSRLRYMIDAIPDMIFFKDTESRFLGCNTAFEKYINRKSDEIIGLSEFDLFPAEKAEGYIQSDKTIFETLKPERNSEWLLVANGQRRLFDTLKTPYFDAQNNVLGIIGISRDITDMDETRQRLVVAKEKAEESDRLKTAFLANMSHEIRTPMNAIIGFSDLLSDDDLTQEERNDFLSKIKIAGRSLISLINDIIDIAKIEAGQLKITESDVDVNELLTELEGMFMELKNSAGKQDIKLGMVLPPKALKLVTDPSRLQQILVNLLSNALKFTETGTIEFGYSVDAGKVRFYVSDTGIGILRSKQKLLFQRFSQLDPSATRKYGGTGLGLAISKNLAELLGGNLWVESAPGKGSTFYLDLPNKTPVIKPAPKNRAELRKLKWPGKTILIAEDIMQNFMLLEAVLRYTEVKLIHAVDGQVAIDIVRSTPGIDLVLMDIQLPIKTGYEALVEIHELNPDIPVLCYTAFALPHEREKSLAAGFADYIPKPIKAESLIPMLDHYLGTGDKPE